MVGSAPYVVAFAADVRIAEEHFSTQMRCCGTYKLTRAIMNPKLLTSRNSCPRLSCLGPLLQYPLRTDCLMGPNKAEELSVSRVGVSGTTFFRLQVRYY